MYNSMYIFVKPGFPKAQFEEVGNSCFEFVGSIDTADDDESTDDFIVTSV